jgi:transposase
MDRKHYTKEFKLGAVKLVVDEGVAPAKVGRDLGVSYYTVKNWVNAFRKNKESSFPGKGNLLPADQEKRDLENQLRRVTMERDLLKKTIAFFAEQDRKNMMP